MNLRPTGQTPQAEVASRELVRAAAAVFLIAVLVAIVGPLLSYQSDVSQLRDLFRDRVVREASFHADALAHTFRLLQAELSRLAQRPEIDPTDLTSEPEQLLLDLAHHHSVLFAGVAVLDVDGNVVWSEPKGIRGEDFQTRTWMRRFDRDRSAIIDVVAQGEHTFLIAEPVERDGRLLGALMGLFNPRLDENAAGDVSEDLQMLVIDGTGDVLYPTHDVPDWAGHPDLLPRVESLLKQPDGETLGLGHDDLYAAAGAVGDTGLRVVLVGSESAVTAPVRRRFFAQFLLLMVLQTSAVALLSIFVQRTYRRFVAMESRAVERDRLVALGGASSLIAHEVRNSLNGLKAAVALIGADGDRSLPVGTIRAEVDRLQHLANSLLLFGKPAAAQPRPTALNELVEEIVAGLRELPGAEEVAITTDLPPEASMPCDPLLVATAVHNVVRNAIEAGILAKDLGRVSSPAVHVALSRTVAEARIVVTDNAGGPAPGVAEHLFTPFVSAKPAGIGLGLAMSRQAMDAQGGALVFERTKDGSRFMLQIRRPLVPAEAAV